MPVSSAPVPRRAAGFVLLYALASAGGVIAYLPLLSLLLPIKVERLTGDARLDVLTACAIAGGIAASLANIGFGWLSDRRVARGGGRRGLIALGAAATALTYAGIAAASSPLAVVVSVAAFQVAVNLLLAPLGAIMADEIPDAQRGLAGGLLALGNPMGAGVSAALVFVAADEATRLAVVALLFAAAIAPILLVRGVPQQAPPSSPGRTARRWRDLAIVWAARLLVQVAGIALSLYLLYYLESIAPDASPYRLAALTGQVLTIVHVLPLPVAIALGRASDLLGRRKPILVTAATVAAAGLALMGFATHWTAGAAGFAIYSIGSAVFLVLQSAFATQLLPDAAHRGRDLGLFNLANTLPSLLGPLLTWLLATPSDFTALMLPLAALTLAGGVTILFAREPARG